MSHVNDSKDSIELIGSQIAKASQVERFDLLARRAKAYRIQGDVRAIGDYIDIVDGASDKSLVCHAQAMLALISMEADELKEALWWGMSAINTNERQFDGNLAVGLVLDAAELHKVAVHYFRRALELDKSSELARLKLAISFRESMLFADADNEFRALLTQSPDNAKYNYEYAWNWQLRHDVENHYELAVEHYEKALTCGPNEELRSKIERKLQAIAR
jgi:tetratricopeptide (TPR) repeat protein